MSNEWDGKSFTPADPIDVLSVHEIVLPCSELTKKRNLEVIVQKIRSAFDSACSADHH